MFMLSLRMFGSRLPKCPERIESREVSKMDSPDRSRCASGGCLLSKVVTVGVCVHLLFAGGACDGRARVAALAARPFRQVRSTQGTARGYFAPRPPHYAFLGLPYARAPTATHRFKAPAPPPTWDGIFEATHRVKCPQDGSGDENCLVLNVFVPENGTGMPVVVFVHDGHFQNGKGAHQPPAHLLNQGFVIVTFNYRLGLIGFLCVGTPEASGNAGLKDQVAALYWIQRNIASFGGDPSDVTVYGIGSGAIAIHLLLLSGLTEGLFHKVVLESGSALSPSSLNYEPVSLARTAAVNLGYEGAEDLNELVQFLQKVPAKNLSKISEIFLPCIESYDYDQSLLDWDPIEVLKKGSFQQVPVLMLYSQHDGMNLIMNNLDRFENKPLHFEDLLPNNLKFNDEKTKLKIGQFVKEFYFDDINNSIEQNYADYFHDVLFEYPIVKSAILYAEQSFLPLYILKFGYKRITRNLESADYDKIIDYIFGKEDLEEDVTITEKLITLLSSFIRIGDPTPITTSLIPIIWQPVQEDSDGKLNVRTASVLLLDKSITMSSTATNQRLTFWDHVYENFYRTQAPIHEDLD